eukprot:2477895-Pleurochrysis_carterae.AAC.1
MSCRPHSITKTHSPTRCSAGAGTRTLPGGVSKSDSRRMAGHVPNTSVPRCGSIASHATTCA